MGTGENATHTYVASIDIGSFLSNDDVEVHANDTGNDNANHGNGLATLWIRPNIEETVVGQGNKFHPHTPKHDPRKTHGRSHPLPSENLCRLDPDGGTATLPKDLEPGGTPHEPVEDDVEKKDTENERIH